MNAKPLDEEAIFTVARRLPADARPTYLDQVCGDDHALRRSVEALLKANDADDFLVQPSAAMAATLEQPITEKPGTQIGPYKLLQQIGEGGFGVVFMAEQREPVIRKVALKVIKPGMDTQEVIARFEAERQALAMMEHPNIARVLDAGSTDSGRPYFVMELVKGVPITEYCDKNDLPAEERLKLFVAVCRAVQHAHQKGVIHRDIKPSNILVTLHDGHPVPKVIDFGVSKAISQRLTEKTLFTAFGRMIGTPQYMSPEQAEMSGLDVDTRSDVYSLGVLLYELLTGTTPLEADQLRAAGYVEMQRMIREQEPPKPSVRLSTLGDQLTVVAKHRSTDPKRLRQSLRGELDWIVMKSLEKERGRRYESPNSFAADVERFLSGTAVEAHPPSAAYRVRKFVRRYRLPVAVATVVLAATFLGIVGLAVGLFQAQRRATVERVARERATRLTQDKEQALQETQEARKTAEDEASRSRRLLYVADMSLANQAWQSGDATRLESLLRRHVPRIGENDPRGFEWFYLWRLWNRESQSDCILPADSRTYWSWLALSSDGSRMAVGDPRGQPAVTVVDTNTRKEIDSFGKGPLLWVGGALAMSSDGKVVAYRASRQSMDELPVDREGGSVIVREIDTGTERTIDTGAISVTIALSPDLRTLAIGGPDSAIWLWDLKEWGRIAELEGHEGQIHAVAFSPDGTNLVSAGDDKTVRMWDVGTRRNIWTGRGNSGKPISVTYSPKGRFVATGSSDALVAVWDAATGERLQTLVGARDEIRVVVFSHDEQLLAAGCREGVVRLWRLPDFAEHETVGGFSGMYALAFLPDGGLVFPSYNNSLVVRNVPATKYGVLSVPEPHRVIRCAAFSSDGSVVCAIEAGQPRIVYFWKLMEDGASALAPLALERDATGLAVSPEDVLAVGDSASATVHLFSLLTHQSKGRLEIARPVGTARVRFSPNGKRLAIGCDDGSVTVWSVETGKILMDQKAHGGRVRDLCFCGEGSELLTGSVDGFARLWDLEKGELLHTFGKHPSSIMAVCTADDGKMLATGTFPRDSNVRVYDRGTYARVGLLRGHTAAVRGLSFLHDGKSLASAGGDRTVRLWDMATGEERFVFDGGTCIFEFIELSPDGRTIAAGGRDGTIRLFRAASPEEVKSKDGWWLAEQ